MSSIPFGQVEAPPISVGPPPLQSLDTAAQLSGGPALVGIGQGLGAVSDLADRMVKAREGQQVSNALVDAQDKLASYRMDLQNDPDTASREQKFAGKMQDVRAATTNAMSGRAAEQFNLRFNTLFRPMQLEVKQQARDEERQNFKIGLFDNLEKMATSAVFAKTPQERQAIQAEADRSITDAVATGRIPAVQARQYQKAYLGKVDGALASEMVRQNPGAAIGALGDPDQFKYLSAEQRVQLRAMATQRSESLGVQARAELRADAGDFMQDIVRGATTGQMPAQQDFDAIMKRAGPKSAVGVRLQHAWDFYSQVSSDASGKTIPELQSAVVAAQRGSQPPDDTNLKAADADLKLTPQEKGLYQRHLGNVVGPGGVDNPDGSRSTLYQTSFERDGRTYNVPTVWDGKILPPDEAIKRADAQGLDQFPSYGSQAEAEARYAKMHDYMEKDIGGRATPEDLHRARVLQAALQQKIAARDKDPAAYALGQYPTVAEQLANADKMDQSNDANAKAQASDVRQLAWSALVAAQGREGVPTSAIALLPKKAAEDLRQKLLTTEGQAKADLVDQLRGQFGEQWPRVANQLWNGKPAPADVQVLGALPDGANLPKVEVAEAFKVTDEQAKQVLGPTRMTAIDAATRQAVAQIAPTMMNAPDGPQFMATYQTAIEKLARLYAMRGEGDDTTAAQRAAQRLFFDHWDTVGTVRVPKIDGQPVADGGDVRAAQATVFDALPRLELTVPAHDRAISDAAAKDMLLRSVRSNGYWMTTADDRGMVLMAGPGLAVRFADGQPLIVPFDTARAMAANRAAQRNLGRREMAQYHPGGEGENITVPQDLGADEGEPNARLLPPWIVHWLSSAGQGAAAIAKAGMAQP